MPELHVPITGLYAAIQGVIALALTFPIGPIRLRENVSLGDASKPDLRVAIRRHGNWTEHVPFALLLLALLELNGAGSTLLHTLGAALVVARIAHPLGLHADNLRSPLRIAGAAGTGIVTAVAVIVLFLDYVR